MGDMQQSKRQASVRAVTGTTHTYEGDWHALWDILAIPAGDYNGRMLQYINIVLGTSYTEINGAMAAFAIANGATTFQAVGTFTATVFTAPVLAFVDPVDPDSDSTPDLYIDLVEPPGGGTHEGYFLKIHGTFGSATVTATHDIDISHEITALEASNLEITLASTPAAPDGLLAELAYIGLPVSGNRASPDSNTVSKTIAAAGAGQFYQLLFAA